MSFQLFTLPAAAGCPQCPSPRCASSTTSWACPSGLTPLNAQWFQLVLLYLVGVLHQQPTEPVLQLWLLSETSGSSLCPCTLLVCFIYNLLSLPFRSDSSQRPVVPACALYLVGVLHLQPTEPALQVWFLSKTSGTSLLALQLYWSGWLALQLVSSTCNLLT